MSVLNRRTMLRAAVALACAGALMAGPAQAQQGGSDRPIRLLVGFPPGTAPDTVARIVAQKMSENLQQSIVIENAAGAGGLIAARQAARAPADGSTLFLNTVSDMSIAPHIYNQLAYNPDDFGLISHLVYADNILVVPPSVPANNLKEFVEWGRQQNPLFMATFGAGTPAHFGLTVFGSTFGLEPQPIHYRTTGDAMSGVLSGEVPGVFVSSALGVPYVKDGRLRALAVTSPARMEAIPEVPTFAELGYPQAEYASWFGLAAPPGAPDAFLERMSIEARKALQSPDVRGKLEGLGFRVSGTDREEFGRIVQKENEMWGKVAAATGFKAD